MPLRKWSVTSYSRGVASRPCRFWTYDGALKAAKRDISGVGYDKAVIDGPLPRYVPALRADWQNTSDQERRELQGLFPELYQAVERCVALGETAALVMEWLKLGHKPEYLLWGRSYFGSLANAVYFAKAEATVVEGAQ